ncbi:MAG: hypothetical protein ACJA1L_000902 [Paracoccaceae bacterium]|jgi:hypothetical protein
MGALILGVALCIPVWGVLTAAEAIWRLAPP